MTGASNLDHRKKGPINKIHRRARARRKEIDEGSFEYIQLR